MPSILNKFRKEGGHMEKEKTTKVASENKSKNPLKLVTPQTAFWVGATVIFAALFFMSSILDMKVHLTFGQSSGAVNSQVTSPGTAAPAAPAGGIADQVGGC